MSKLVNVYRCDRCDRVVAELRDDGTLLIRQIHNKERHETRIALPGRTEASSIGGNL
jgi:hypothetical protein